MILNSMNTPSRCTSPVLCHYRNATPQLQVARVFHQAALLAERVVFPWEFWLFEAPIEATLQIYSNTLTDHAAMQVVGCDRRQVNAISKSDVA